MLNPNILVQNESYFNLHLTEKVTTKQRTKEKNDFFTT